LSNPGIEARISDSRPTSSPPHETQASLPGQDAVLLLLFGLLRSDHVKLRTIDGWDEMERVGQAA
jgi:hypothetical protein